MQNDRNARLMLAEALLLTRRYDEAIVRFRGAAELLPDSARAWYGLGQAYDALAERTAAQIQADSPSSAEAYAVAGDIHARQGKFGAAFLELRRAFELDPSLAGLHSALARVYRKTGHAEWAAEAETVEHGANTARNRAYEAYLTCRKNAADAYAKLDSLPESVEQHLHRAKSLDTEGRYTEAIIEWRKAVKLAPDNSRFQIGLAWSLFRRRDYDAVLSLTNELLRSDPRSVEGNFLSGAALLNLDRPDAALPYLMTAAESDGTFLPAQAALGQAMLRTGDAAKAIPHLIAALPADDDGTVRFQLSRAYSKSGQQDLARKALSEYQAFRVEREEALEREARVPITRIGPIAGRAHEP
jgi:Flp pilus assembly protein TadD